MLNINGSVAVMEEYCRLENHFENPKDRRFEEGEQEDDSVNKLVMKLKFEDIDHPF